MKAFFASFASRRLHKSIVQTTNGTFKYVNSSPVIMKAYPYKSVQISS